MSEFPDVSTSFHKRNVAAIRVIDSKDDHCLAGEHEPGTIILELRPPTLPQIQPEDIVAKED